MVTREATFASGPVTLTPAWLGVTPASLAWRTLRELAGEDTGTAAALHDLATAGVLGQVAVTGADAGGTLLASLCDAVEAAGSARGVAAPLLAAFSSARRSGDTPEVRRAERLLAAERERWRRAGADRTVPVWDAGAGTVTVRDLTTGADGPAPGLPSWGLAVTGLATAVVGAVTLRTALTARTSGGLPVAAQEVVEALRGTVDPDRVPSRSRSEAAAAALATGTAVAVYVEPLEPAAMASGVTPDALAAVWRRGVLRMPAFLATGPGLDSQLVRVDGPRLHLPDLPKLTGSQVGDHGFLTALLGPVPAAVAVTTELTRALLAAAGGAGSGRGTGELVPDRRRSDPFERRIRARLEPGVGLGSPRGLLWAHATHPEMFGSLSPRQRLALLVAAAEEPLVGPWSGVPGQRPI